MIKEVNKTLTFQTNEKGMYSLKRIHAFSSYYFSQFPQHL